MKTVKKLIIERISSVDHSDGNNSSPGGNDSGSSKKPTSTSKQKIADINNTKSPATTNDAQLTPDTDCGGGGGIGIGITDTVEPMAPYATADPSPSPSICAETPNADGLPISGGDRRSPSSAPTGHYSCSPTTNSPFNFTPNATNSIANNVSSAGVSNSLSAPAIKQQKSRRKISLPWFRQTSVVNSGLTRQYTIDSPGSFRLFRQSSNIFKVCLLGV
ncbi:unnamed protein product [Ceratitis capitata]|uniref:(Mediterranean fruit fly) hypothetical protein n=1 Tax=Ceratitis capitata TaxID=7213 RepID=W8API9_CERCA|nr:unnamed protein product [Ceratitis capitata]